MGRMALFVFGVYFSSAISAGSGGLTVKGPDSPRAPRISDALSAKHTFRVDLFFAGGKKKSGTIILPFEIIPCKSGNDGKMKEPPVKLSSVYSVSFTQWRKVKRRKNEFAFYPAFCTITLKNGEKFDCYNSGRIFNKIIYIKKKKRLFFYTYFYDYQKSKRWINSRSNDDAYPETHPLPDVVVKLVFKGNKSDSGDIRKSLQNIFNTIIR